MKQFNEDHPDFEQYVKGLTEGRDEDDRVVQMMALACPTELLLFLLHDEIRGTRHQVYGVVGCGGLTAFWTVWPLIATVLGFALPGPISWVMAALTGGVTGYLIGATRRRWQRNRDFIKPAHEALHKFLDEAT